MMVLGIDIPKGAKVEVQPDGKLLIIFDEKRTRADLWKAQLSMWLTEGGTAAEFYDNKSLSSKALTISHKNTLKLGSW